MKTRKRLLLVVVVLVALAPLLMAADTGPKPKMHFTLEYEISPAPEITTATLLECQQSDCSDAVPLAELGPQGVWCDSNTECRSTAYGYNGEYFQLVLAFSDGITRTSNIFTKNKFEANYTVSVQADALLVKAAGGSGVPLSNAFTALLLTVGLSVLIVVVSLVMIGRTRRRLRENGPGSGG